MGMGQIKLTRLITSYARKLTIQRWDVSDSRDIILITSNLDLLMAYCVMKHILVYAEKIQTSFVITILVDHTQNVIT